MAKHQEDEKYLKSDQYYIDLYDLVTINRCLDIVRFYQKAYKEQFNNKAIKDLPKEEKYKGFSYFLHWELLSTKTNRYKDKEETIKEWIERDTKYQYKYDNAIEPNYYCPKCNTQTKSTFKTLINYMHKEPDRMLFFMECDKCDKRYGIYEGGQVRESKPELCPKCNKKVTETSKHKGEIYTFTTKCKSCNYKDIRTEDFEKSRLEHEKKEQEDKELLEKYSEEFCFSDKEGKEYVELFEAMEVAEVVYEEELAKYDNQFYEKSLQLKKTTIVELEKTLNKALENTKFIKLTLEKPIIDMYVTVPFTLQDENSERSSRESIQDLEKVFQNSIKDTNWRLINNSISYRLGYLEGRLKGYEREEDILKLVGKQEDPKPKKKADPDKLFKYGSHNIVQMAKMSGKWQGVKNLRTRRLEKEPEGFYLDASDGSGYSCGICGGSHEGNKIWWNLEGIRCSNCWENMKAGVIPKDLMHMYDKDKQWISDWEFKDKYGVHPATRDKLTKQGFLKVRELKNPLGQIYCSVYLKKENKPFLDKYPEIPKTEPKITVTTSSSKNQ